MTYQAFIMKTIEKMREDKHMSQEMLLEDITSKRSYYRYINLDIEIPYDILLALVTKLNIQLDDLMFEHNDALINDEWIGKFIRQSRLERYDEAQKAKEMMLTQSLTDKQQLLLEQINESPKEALATYFSDTFHINDASLEDVIKHIDFGKDFHILLEFMITLTYEAVEHQKESLYDMFEKILSHYKTKTTDGYINYPLTYLQCHMYQHHDTLFEESVIKHLALHHFFSDHVSTKAYVDTLSKKFQKDIRLIFETFIEKAI